MGECFVRKLKEKSFGARLITTSSGINNLDLINSLPLSLVKWQRKQTSFSVKRASHAVYFNDLSSRFVHFLMLICERNKNDENGFLNDFLPLQLSRCVSCKLTSRFGKLSTLFMSCSVTILAHHLCINRLCIATRNSRQHAMIP